MTARILPTLPGCGRAASARIEVYSPARGTAYGSLDAVAYGCDQHAGAIIQMIHDAGLTAWRDPNPVERADQSVCGRLRQFGPPFVSVVDLAPVAQHRATRTAAEIVAGPPLPHQPWCRPDGHPATPTYHVSPDVEIERTNDGAITLATLEQATDAPQPYVLLQHWHARPDDTVPPQNPQEADERILLPLAAASQLLTGLRALLTMAGGEPR